MATLRLFASAREAAGTGSDEIDASTVGELLSEARKRYGDAFGGILDNSRIWLDGEPAEPETAITAESEVAVLPPVSGGHR